MAMFFMDTLAASMRLSPFSERRPVRVSRLRRGTSVSSFMKRLQMPGRHARMPLKDTVPRMVSACMAPGPVGVLRMELQLTTVSSRVIGEKTTLPAVVSEPGPARLARASLATSSMADLAKRAEPATRQRRSAVVTVMAIMIFFMLCLPDLLS